MKKEPPELQLQGFGDIQKGISYVSHYYDTSSRAVAFENTANKDSNSPTPKPELGQVAR